MSGLFKKTTITASVDTGDAASRTNATKTWFNNVVTDLELGIFASLSDTQPVLHWDTTRKAYMWGAGGASSPDLFLQRYGSAGLELRDAANSSYRDIVIRRLGLLDGAADATPPSGLSYLYVDNTADYLRIRHAGSGEHGWLEERPYACALNDSDLDIGDAVWSAVTLNSESEDTYGFHNPSSNTDRLTIPSGMGGLYLFGAHIRWNSITGGAHNIYGLRLALTGNVVALDQMTHYEGGIMSQSIFTVARCADADYMKLAAYQTSGDTLAIDYQSGYSPLFWCTQLGK